MSTFDQKFLLERAENALNYKTNIAEAATNGGNNEVTVKYRHHAGIFPLFGTPATALPKQAREMLPSLQDNEYLLANFDAPVGKITNLGQFSTL